MYGKDDELLFWIPLSLLTSHATHLSVVDKIGCDGGDELDFVMGELMCPFLLTIFIIDKRNEIFQL